MRVGIACMIRASLDWQHQQHDYVRRTERELPAVVTLVHVYIRIGVGLRSLVVFSFVFPQLRGDITN